MSLPPDGYSVRPPRPDEVVPIAELVAAADASFGQPPSVSAEMIADTWRSPRFVLDDDAWLVERDGLPAAYADVWDMDPTRVEALAVVHPDHRGRGLGAFLAATIEQRARRKVPGPARLFSTFLAQDEAARALLEGRGYSFARRFRHMEADVADARAPSPPPGVALRTIDPDRDLAAVHRVLEESFEDHWDFSPTAFEEFLDRNVRDESFDPALWLVALDGSDVVGALISVAHAEIGWVNDLGVVRSHRGRGIAAALLQQAFAAFRDRGLLRVRLNVDSENLTGAVRLYERVGMVETNTYDIHALDIDGGQSSESSS